MSHFIRYFFLAYQKKCCYSIGSLTKPQLINIPAA